VTIKYLLRRQKKYSDSNKFDKSMTLRNESAFSRMLELSHIYCKKPKLNDFNAFIFLAVISLPLSVHMIEPYRKAVLIVFNRNVLVMY